MNSEIRLASSAVRGVMAGNIAVSSGRSDQPAHAGERQLPIADAAVTIFQRRAVAELRDRAIEQLRYHRGRNRRVPAHPRGIRLLPPKREAGAPAAPFAAVAPKLPFSFASRLSNADGLCRASPLSRASRASRSRMRESPTVSA